MLCKSSGSLLCSCAVAFDLAANSFIFSCDACSSGRCARIPGLLLWFESITNLFDPWEILTQNWELSSLRDQILISIPCLPYRQLVVFSNTSPILMFPWIHPFVCDVDSSLERVYSRQTFAKNCSPMSLVMKYCPISTTCKNPASMQNLLTLFSCEYILIRSSNRCNRRFSCDGNVILQRNFCLDFTKNNWLSNQYIRLPWSILKGFKFFTHVCNCSAKTELIGQSNYAKNSLNCLMIRNKM